MKENNNTCKILINSLTGWKRLKMNPLNLVGINISQKLSENVTEHLPGSSHTKSRFWCGFNGKQFPSWNVAVQCYHVDLSKELFNLRRKSLNLIFAPFNEVFFSHIYLQLVSNINILLARTAVEFTWSKCKVYFIESETSCPIPFFNDLKRNPLTIRSRAVSISFNSF